MMGPTRFLVLSAITVGLHAASIHKEIHDLEVHAACCSVFGDAYSVCMTCILLKHMCHVPNMYTLI